MIISTHGINKLTFVTETLYVLCEVGTLLVKEFPAFHRTQLFITLSKTA
jgi:hypothetical protein